MTLHGSESLWHARSMAAWCADSLLSDLEADPAPAMDCFDRAAIAAKLQGTVSAMENWNGRGCERLRRMAADIEGIRACVGSVMDSEASQMLNHRFMLCLYGMLKAAASHLCDAIKATENISAGDYAKIERAAMYAAECLDLLGKHKATLRPGERAAVPGIEALLTDIDGLPCKAIYTAADVAAIAAIANRAGGIASQFGRDAASPNSVASKAGNWLLAVVVALDGVGLKGGQTADAQPPECRPHSRMLALIHDASRLKSAIAEIVASDDVCEATSRDGNLAFIATEMLRDMNCLLVKANHIAKAFSPPPPQESGSDGDSLMERVAEGEL